MKDSKFYTLAYEPLKTETDRIEAFSTALDSNMTEKQKRIEEYKMARYRYGAVCAIVNALFFSNKLIDKLYETHFVLEPYDALIKNDAEFLKAFNEADEDKKSDVGLYYGILAYADLLIEEKAQKLSFANEQEKVELNCYIDGYRFAKKCIKEAWCKVYKEKMTAVEIEKALANIVLDMMKECKTRLAALPDNAKNEKKAIMIEDGMYSMGIRAGLLYNTNGDREGAIRIKSTRMPHVCRNFPDVLEAFENADAEEKMRITAALYGEVWITGEYHQANIAELSAAKESRDISRIFEYTIKVGAIEAMLKAWKAWRRENGIYPTLLEDK